VQAADEKDMLSVAFDWIDHHLALKNSAAPP
jgi:hypothetical protein